MKEEFLRAVDKAGGNYKLALTIGVQPAIITFIAQGKRCGSKSTWRKITNYVGEYPTEREFLEFYTSVKNDFNTKRLLDEIDRRGA